MNKIDDVNFIANTRLKDIVGRGLIYNDNIALIELIKNSKDADSPKVELVFENANEESPLSKIIIRDFGKGMSYDDIIEKWLNIAYSAKKNNLKDDGKTYAGNKGIGRFSCDRIGKKLDLYTIQKEKDGYHFHIDWEKYELDDPTITIQNYKFPIFKQSREELKTVFNSSYFTSGTTLVISDLRSQWDISKLDKLKKELEKFVISPNDEMSIGDFDVFIETNYLNKTDKGLIEGLIQNKVFDELEFRTTSVESKIDKSGEKLITSLKHDGNTIFTITEKNPYTKLKNIKSKIYYLNTASKSFFTKKTGYRHLDYGSVLMFLNGFRVFPYGESGNDWLDLDKRKTQGYSRNLGTREIVGYVSAEDNDAIFVPVSAREGLVKNEAFQQLQSMYDLPNISKPGFVSKSLRRLEKFVVDGLDWDSIPDVSPTEKFENINPADIKYANSDKMILEVLSTVIYLGTTRSDVIDLIINFDYLKQLADKEKEAFKTFANQIKSKLDNASDFIANKDSIFTLIEEQDKKLKQKDEINKNLSTEKAYLEEVIEQKDEEIEEKEETIIHQKNEITKQTQKAKQKEDENLFLRSAAPKDADHLRNLMHKINDDVSFVKQVTNNYWSARKDNETFTNDDFDVIIDKIHKRINTIGKIADFATYRNYRMATEQKEVKILEFISNYINLLIEEELHSDKIILVNELLLKKDLKLNIKPINISILIDNIISNSKKAEAPELKILSKFQANNLVVEFLDNGKGLSSEYTSSQIFEKGFTTTNGSGLGLFHSKTIIEEEFTNGEIGAIFGDNMKGFKLEVKIPCA